MPTNERTRIRRFVDSAVRLVTSWPRITLGVILVLVASLGVSMCAEAQTTTPVACPGTIPPDGACLSWTLPTLNTDGSAIPATGTAALTQVRISRSLCNADGTPGAEVQLLILPPDTTGMFISALPPARHCFRVRVRNGETNDADALSAWAGPARKTTTAPAPPKPRAPTITIT